MSWFAPPPRGEEFRQPGTPPDTRTSPPGPPAVPGNSSAPQPPAGPDLASGIAGNLFVIAHRDWDGKPLLSPRLMGLAMAGAVLCELALLERVGVRDHDLIILNGTPVSEEVTGTVLRQVLSEPTPLPIKDWIAYLASDSVTAVGGRLVRAGVVQASKRLRGVRYVPVDGTATFFTVGRLAVMLENGSHFSPPEATLIGLVDAAGLLEQLPMVKPAANRARVAAVVQSLTWPLDGLVAATSGVIENAILTGRT